MSKSNPINPLKSLSSSEHETATRETDAQIAERRTQADAATDHKFRGWRLLGVVALVVVLLAVASAVVDWLVIGPLEGRMF